MLKIFIYSLLIAFLSPAGAFSETEKQTINLAREYFTALKNNDEKTAKAALKKLNRNPESALFQQEKSPRAFISMELNALATKIDDLKDKYDSALNPSFASFDFNEKSKSTLHPHHTNRDDTRQLPNQKRPSHFEVIEALPNQDRLKNHITVRRFPNQVKVSNQERIRNRK